VTAARKVTLLPPSFERQRRIRMAGRFGAWVGAMLDAIDWTHGALTKGRRGQGNALAWLLGQCETRRAPGIDQAQSVIAGALGCGDRQVRNLWTELEAAGLVYIDHRGWRPRKGGRATLWVFPRAALAAVQSLPPDRLLALCNAQAAAWERDSHGRRVTDPTERGRLKRIECERVEALRAALAWYAAAESAPPPRDQPEASFRTALGGVAPEPTQGSPFGAGALISTPARPARGASGVDNSAVADAGDGAPRPGEGAVLRPATSDESPSDERPGELVGEATDAGAPSETKAEGQGEQVAGRRGALVALSELLRATQEAHDAETVRRWEREMGAPPPLDEQAAERARWHRQDDARRRRAAAARAAGAEKRERPPGGWRQSAADAKRNALDLVLRLRRQDREAREAAREAKRLEVYRSTGVGWLAHLSPTERDDWAAEARATHGEAAFEIVAERWRELARARGWRDA
jgi:hypothetical protein